MQDAKVSRRRNLLAWCAIFLMVTLYLLPHSGEVSAEGGLVPDCRFWGTVKVYGEWVTNGTVVTAWIDGVSNTWTAETTLMEDSVSGENISVYSLDVPADNPPTVDGGGLGDRVYFEIEYGGVNLTMAETGVWDNNGGFTNLDLTVPLQATLSGQPTGVVNYNTASIMVDGGGVVAYEYKLDTGNWSVETPVDTNITISGLSDGVHTVYVIGKNAVGNWRQSEAAATTAAWVVDTTPPVAALSGQPVGVVNYNTANITVVGTDVVAYKYKLDTGSWSGETSVSMPIECSGLGDGLRLLYVIGKDPVGNWQAVGEATVAGWVVDTTLPQASLLGQPLGVVNYNTAEIFVYGADMAAYRWKLDSNSWSEVKPITTSISLSGLNEGNHTIYVIGEDAAGNWQGEGSATTVSWTVDTTPPTATLSGQPIGWVNYKTANITVGGTDVVAYRYRLDVDAGFWSGEMPAANHVSLSGLSDGNHTIYVQGKDTAGNWQAGESMASWVVDTTPPPVPTLVFPGSAAKVKNSPVSLQWSAVDDASGVRYNLQISDSQEFDLLEVNAVGLDFSSFNTTALEDGTYYWRVKAVDGVGNYGGWSESRSFTVGGKSSGWWLVVLMVALVGAGAMGVIFWRQRRLRRV